MQSSYNSRQMVVKESVFYCVKLNNGGYAMTDSMDEISELKYNTYADIFSSIEEAEEFCTKHWLDARAEVWNR